MKQKTIIKATILYDGITKHHDKTIIIEKDRIVEVSSKSLKADYEGYVTPGFIDAHSHIGLVRHGEPSQEMEGNEILDQILPLLNPLEPV